MIIYKVTPDHHYGEGSDEAYAKQASMLAEEGVIAPEDRHAAVYCEAQTALNLILKGYCGSYSIPQKVEKVYEITDGGNTVGPTAEDLFNKMILRMSDVLQTTTQAGLNKRTGSQQPGEGLLVITETMLLEDSCTDSLQGYLSEGWRIVAVQPQPDQRRPDYILGRPAQVSLPDRAQRG